MLHKIANVLKYTADKKPLCDRKITANNKSLACIDRVYDFKC